MEDSGREVVTLDQYREEVPPLAHLLVAVALGDHSAFGELYRRTWGHVFTVVRQCLIDESQSEEVAQDVFLEVWQTAARFDVSRGSVITWLATLARRRAIDRVRSAQASRRRENTDWARSQGGAADEVLDAVDQRFEHRTLMAAMESLSALQREALNATYLEDRTVVQAASLLGASESALKARMRDAVIKLRITMLPLEGTG